MRQSFLTLIILLTIASCSHPIALSESEKEGIAAEVRQTLNNYYADIEKSGLTAEFRYLDNSPEFFWVPPGYSGSLSYDSVAAVINQNASKYKSVRNSFENLKIIPLSKNLATYTGKLSSTMVEVSGNVLTFSMVETGVVIKRHDGWKLLHGQTAILNQ